MNDEQLLRYNRQLMMADFDYQGQQSLLDAKVLIVGLGGLGCPAAIYLATAGVGELWLADHDQVELSNLQRQIAHSMDDLGRPKVVSASEALAALNPDVITQCINEKLDGQLLIDAISQVDLVVDASDNFATRFAINQACVELKTPLVSGAAIRTEGQVMVVDSRVAGSPCYRCLYEDGGDDQNLSCSESGVLAPLVGIIGSIQALEAIKVLANYGEPLVGSLLIFDGKVMEWRKLKLSQNAECPVCQH
jgi:adenylyltransferase/sulfurtransferase